jgi:hypothetical protein
MTQLKVERMTWLQYTKTHLAAIAPLSCCRLALTPIWSPTIQKHHGWSDATFQTINWKVHAQVLRNHITLRIHFSKLVHDILPTTAQLNKMDKGKTMLPTVRSPTQRPGPYH